MLIERRQMPESLIYFYLSYETLAQVSYEHLTQVKMIMEDCITYELLYCFNLIFDKHTVLSFS